IRSQVTEGLTLASDLKAGVAELFAQTGDFSAIDMDALGLGEVTKTGKYVTDITVAGGVITIEYGKDAHSNISGETLSLTPGVNTNGDVIWVCGGATAPADVTMESAGTTSVEDKYL